MLLWSLSLIGWALLTLMPLALFALAVYGFRTNRPIIVPWRSVRPLPAYMGTAYGLMMCGFADKSSFDWKTFFALYLGFMLVMTGFYAKREGFLILGIKREPYLHLLQQARLYLPPEAGALVKSRFGFSGKLPMTKVRFGHNQGTGAFLAWKGQRDVPLEQLQSDAQAYLVRENIKANRTFFVCAMILTAPTLIAVPLQCLAIYKYFV